MLHKQNQSEKINTHLQFDEDDDDEDEESSDDLVKQLTELNIETLG